MKFNLTGLEKEIMNYIWDRKRWTSGAELWDYFNRNGMSHKRQTVNTYLTRMTEKGLLVKHEKKYMYSFTKEELDQKIANEILEDLYEGSLQNFITAFTAKKKITPEEAIQLKRIIDNTQ